MLSNTRYIETVALENTSIPHVNFRKKSCTDNFEAMKFCLLFKIFSWQTTTNYHILGLRGCFEGLSWHACLRRACFRPACFLCLHDMSLSCVFLDPAIIVFDVTCACGTPWTFLLTFFNKWCKMEDENVAIPLCLIIMLVQYWEFDVTGGSRGDGCVRLIPSIDHRSTHSSCLFNRWANVP